ncbi:prepilin-type N-terminal cleavage/methylation domain-containing protein, partial [bacterium]|nr:prepilin-type N-terminal cleavage/methylation domain-containing protein [bacterium]
MKNSLLVRSLRRKGFTLIEILVVIVIIGILATMGIGKYAQFSRDARKQSCVSNQNTIEKGVGMWEAKFVAIRNPNTGTKHTINFLENGDMKESSVNLPSRINPITPNNADGIY